MKRILFIEARRPGFTHRLPLGVAFEDADGWRFIPQIAGRYPSRRGHPTWGAALPRWTGGLNGTESIVMLDRETTAAAMKRFPDVPEFEATA